MQRPTAWGACALAAFHNFDRDWRRGAGVRFTQRAPSLQEVYADRPQLAASRFEVGNPAVGEVDSARFDLTLRQRAAGSNATVGALCAGRSNVKGVFRSSGHGGVASGAAPFNVAKVGLFEQFNYQQARARCCGLEARTPVPTRRRAWNVVTAKLQADDERATDRSTGQPFPRIAPLRVGAAIGYQREHLDPNLER